jgi:hypothetical protein
MKHFSFSPTLPAKTQRSFIQWYTISRVLILMVLGTLGILQAHQLAQLYRLHCKQKALNQCDFELDTLCNQLATLKKHCETVSVKLSKFQRLRKAGSAPTTYITLLAHLIPHNVCLKNINFEHPRTILLHGKARTQAAAITFLDALIGCPQLCSIKLTNLKQATNEVEFSVTIQII